jgi:hypothetical protein
MSKHHPEGGATLPDKKLTEFMAWLQADGACTARRHTTATGGCVKKAISCLSRFLK